MNTNKISTENSVEDLDFTKIITPDMEAADPTLREFVEYAMKHSTKPDNIPLIEINSNDEKAEEAKKALEDTIENFKKFQNGEITTKITPITQPTTNIQNVEQPKTTEHDSVIEKEEENTDAAIEEYTPIDEPVVCPSCGFVVKTPYIDDEYDMAKDDCTDEDKETFLLSTKTCQQFKKTFSLLDDTLQITFKTPTKIDADACVNAVYELKKQNNILSDDKKFTDAEIRDLYADGNLVLSLDRVVSIVDDTKQIIYQSKEALNKWYCRDAQTNETRQMRLDEIITYCKQCISSLTLYNLIKKCETRFKNIFHYLSNHLFDENFYSATTKNN